MAKRSGGFPGMGGNMNQLMKQAQKMQKQMEEAQAELEEAVYTATAGGGAVEVTISGKKEITSIKFEPEVVDPDGGRFSGEDGKSHWWIRRNGWRIPILDRVRDYGLLQ